MSRSRISSCQSDMKMMRSASWFRRQDGAGSGYARCLIIQPGGPTQAFMLYNSIRTQVADKQGSTCRSTPVDLYRYVTTSLTGEGCPSRCGPGGGRPLAHLHPSPLRRRLSAAADPGPYTREWLQSPAVLDSDVAGSPLTLAGLAGLLVFWPSTAGHRRMESRVGDLKALTGPFVRCTRTRSRFYREQHSQVRQ